MPRGHAAAVLAALLLAAPAEAAFRARDVASCESAVTLALDALAATTGVVAEQPPPDARDPASCAGLRARIEAMKDAALVYHRCVRDPERATFVDEMVTGVLDLRRDMAGCP